MSLLFSLIRLVTPTAYAVTIDQIGNQNPGVAGMWQALIGIFPHALNSDSAYGNGIVFLMLRVAQIVTGLVAGAAVASIIYAGIVLSTSAGEEKLAEARKIATYALLGVVLAVLSDTIILFVCNVIVPLLAGGAVGWNCPGLPF